MDIITLHLLTDFSAYPKGYACGFKSDCSLNAYGLLFPQQQSKFLSLEFEFVLTHLPHLMSHIKTNVCILLNIMARKENI